MVLDALPARAWIWGYAGKARPLQGAPPIHPLAYHSLDVAATMERLLGARPGFRRALVRASGLDEAVAVRWAVLAAALHDLGKYADGFQKKLQREWPGRASCPTPGARSTDHAAAGPAFWSFQCRHALNGRVTTLAPFARLLGGEGAAHRFARWVAAAAGHHGRPVGEFTGGRDNVSPESCRDAAAYIAALFELLPLPAEPRGSEEESPADAWLVAGLVIVADWIGSNREWFPYEPADYDLPAYWPIAQERARKAVTRAGLASPSTPSAAFALADALGERGPDGTPTPLQQWAQDVAVRDRPCLALLEDLTGSGKTEAALILAHRMMAHGLGGGLYWALPTQATANALFGRLSRSYRRLFADAAKPSLALAHAATDLVEEFGDIVREFQEIVDPGANEDPLVAGGEDEDETGSALCAAWLASERRKVFLAEVGVGTIDQALMGTLATKFQSLRLAGLADRILIIDEAHSYDGYTSRLMEGLVAFHAALGGSVIVLSATLSTNLKDRLLSAFRAGRAGRASPGRPLIGLDADTAFPLATLDASAADDKAIPPVETPCASARGTRRDLPVRRLERGEDAQAVLLEAARAGRCAVWVRNTVQDAIDAYEAVRAAAPAGVRVELFHARFTLGDRRRIEADALAAFGKDGAVEARAGRILIATQVVEQSLDLDFDVMVSDLAPLDYLIQRAGRQQRHDRGARRAPVLHVLGPDPYAEIGLDWYAKPFEHAQWVYPDHATLWRTMKLLLEEDGLNLESRSPRALIETIYGAARVEPPPALAARDDEAEARLQAERAAGAARLLRVTDGYTRDARAWMDDERAPTRLGDEQRVVRLARWDGAVLCPWAEHDDPERAWRLSEIQLPVRRAAARPESGDAKLEAEAAKLVASWGRRGKYVLLLPLTQNERGVWVGRLLGGDKAKRTLSYSRDRGGLFTADSPA
jgi:CRISPR-associated endonuclease/helicase Cas3